MSHGLDASILNDFKEEANGLLTELNECVEELESPRTQFPVETLAKFSQRIDRIMGAAQTLQMMSGDHAGIARIASLSEMCKHLGYRATKANAPALIPLFAAFWADTIDLIGELIANLSDPTECEQIGVSQGKALLGRLQWLLGKVNQVSPDAGGNAPDLEKFCR